jgi:CBS domain-containing protein
MAAEPKAAGPDMNAFDAAGLMAQHDIGSVPIVDEEGRLLGLVTDRDLAIRVLASRADPGSVRLGDLANRKGVITTTPDVQVSEVRGLMGEHRIRRLPVVMGERLVGMISLGDIAASKASDRAVGEVLSQISASVSTDEVRNTPDEGNLDRVRERVEGTP